MEKLINNPQDISDSNSPSAFIPFCSFGNVRGSQSGHLPACHLFREKIVMGQVCYEADLNQYKEDTENWIVALQKGFSFIIDTNDEYDVKNIIKKTSENKDVERHEVTAYKETETDREFTILLKTISKYPRIEIFFSKYY